MSAMGVRFGAKEVLWDVTPQNPSLGLQAKLDVLMASPFLPAETLGLSPGACRPVCTCISMTTISRATW